MSLWVVIAMLAEDTAYQFAGRYGHVALAPHAMHDPVVDDPFQSEVFYVRRIYAALKGLLDGYSKFDGYGFKHLSPDLKFLHSVRIQGDSGRLKSRIDLSWAAKRFLLRL